MQVLKCCSALNGTENRQQLHEVVCRTPQSSYTVKLVYFWEGGEVWCHDVQYRETCKSFWHDVPQNENTRCQLPQLMPVDVRAHELQNANPLPTAYSRHADVRSEIQEQACALIAAVDRCHGEHLRYTYFGLTHWKSAGNMTREKVNFRLLHHVPDVHTFSTEHAPPSALRTSLSIPHSCK